MPRIIGAEGYAIPASVPYPAGAYSFPMPAPAPRVLELSGPVVVIGEVAQAHDGSLGAAHAYIDAIADAGAGAVKFQTHIAAAESTAAEPWRVRFSPQDDTRYDYWERMQFTEEQWIGLRRHADERGLLFLSSPFSLEAVELLERVGVAAWKIASGEVTNTVLLERVAGDLPVLLSTGMSRLAELDAAIALLRDHGQGDLAVMQCTSRYPTPPEDVGLRAIGALAARYGCAGGLSDHSGTIFPSIAAATLGARVLEVHVTMSREQFGPDVVASVTTAELRTLTEGVRFVERALAPDVDKDAVADDLEDLRTMFTRSVVARRDLPAGHVLTAEDLAVKKPGGGLPPERLAAIAGRELARSLVTDEPLREADLRS